MNAEHSPNELTSTLHLSLRQVSDSPAGALEEFLATLPEAQRSIIEEVSKAHDKAMVVINKGSNVGSRFLITSAVSSIGRASASDIFLDDVTVSRAHAVIEKNENGFSINDAGSLNGTYVNNISTARQDLKSGDQIQIGKFHLLFISGRK
ncbi:MAG: FHA domain-containing protein [Actinomycetes bacterium]|jgi:hypothetical protein